MPSLKIMLKHALKRGSWRRITAYLKNPVYRTYLQAGSLCYIFFRQALILIYFILTIDLMAELPRTPHGLQPSQYFLFSIFYDQEQRPGQKEAIFHPFYSRYHDKIRGHTFSSSFYPFYYHQQTNHWERWSFLFLFGGNYIRHPDTGDDKDTSYGPLIWHGSGRTEKDKYTSVFPFYGKIKAIFGWSEVNFVLWPIYTNWSHKNYKAHSVLWPFTVYGKNEIRKEYRIFPFYAHKSHVGKYYRNTILWPFWQWGETGLDKVEPIKYGFYFPFYGYKKSMYGNMKSYMLLYLPFPFFAYGYDRRTGATEYRALFSFIQYGYSNDKDYRKTIIFPFYGRSHFAKKTSLFITPLYFHMQSDTYLIKSNSYFLIPFYFQSHRNYIKEQQVESYYKLWPFFRYYKDKEGNLNHHLLTLFPVKSIYIDRIWDPLISIYDYSRLINGEKQLSLFFRFYSQRWSEDDFHMSIPILLEYSKTNHYTSWQIAYGLLGYRKSKQKNTMKFFWFLEI